VATSDNASIDNKYGTDRDTSFGEASFGFVESGL
jgi:hypothetical protein